VSSSEKWNLRGTATRSHVASCHCITDVLALCSRSERTMQAHVIGWRCRSQAWRRPARLDARKAVASAVGFTTEPRSRRKAAGARLGKRGWRQQAGRCGPRPRRDTSYRIRETPTFNRRFAARSWPPVDRTRCCRSSMRHTCPPMRTWPKNMLLHQLEFLQRSLVPAPTSPRSGSGSRENPVSGHVKYVGVAGEYLRPV
jgi:hypothetical protein